MAQVASKYATIGAAALALGQRADALGLVDAGIDKAEKRLFIVAELADKATADNLRNEFGEWPCDVLTEDERVAFPR